MNAPRIQIKVAVVAIKTYKNVYFVLKDKKTIFDYDCWSKRITAEIAIQDMKETVAEYCREGANNFLEIMIIHLECKPPVVFQFFKKLTNEVTECEEKNKEKCLKEFPKLCKSLRDLVIENHLWPELSPEVRVGQLTFDYLTMVTRSIAEQNEEIREMTIPYLRYLCSLWGPICLTCHRVDHVRDCPKTKINFDISE